MDDRAWGTSFACGNEYHGGDDGKPEENPLEESLTPLKLMKTLLKSFHYTRSPSVCPTDTRSRAGAERHPSILPLPAPSARRVQRAVRRVLGFAPRSPHDHSASMPQIMAMLVSRLPPPTHQDPRTYLRYLFDESNRLRCFQTGAYRTLRSTGNEGRGVKPMSMPVRIDAAPSTSIST